MPDIDKNLVMNLRQHLRIVSHNKGKVKLRYRIGAVSIFRQIENSTGGRLLDAIEGVHKASVNPLMFTLTIHYDPQTIEPSWWEELIQDSDEAARQVLDRLNAA
ncbi:hypothetical protein [Algihabitans albus]|uniref:hypothetical protein n=1 Tax=Algihabitans albus TaxID=2164067 RepID=UPI000E5C98C2|nr:hypothetical protein [Algihabitans albus]